MDRESRQAPAIDLTHAFSIGLQEKIVVNIDPIV